MKKMLKNKFKFMFLFLIVSLLSSPFIFSIPKLGFNSNAESYDNNDNQNIEPKHLFNSLPDFIHVIKPTPIAGTQYGTWDEENIRDDDGIYDQTDFEIGTTESTMIYAASSMYSAKGQWGTNNGGFGATSDIDNALLTSDSNNLFVEATRLVWFNPDEFPGWIWMTWSGYANIETNCHKHLYQIRISYDVWADSYPGILDNSQNLRIYVHDDAGHPQYLTLATNPEHRHAYIGTWTINSGTIFDTVRDSNGYIKMGSVEMYANEEIQAFGTYVWLNVNRFRIYYDYYKYDIDFEYEFDYSGLGLTNIGKFHYKIDLSDSVSGVPIYFYNYDTLLWDQKTTTSSMGAEIITGTIVTNADSYFDVYYHLKIKFKVYDFYNNYYFSNYHLRVDQIKIDIPPPDPPSNVLAESSILHIFLTWDIPEDYGAPITQYNVYRGETEGGNKTLIGTPTLNEFNDTSATVGIRYYYTISATSMTGEGANSTEVNGRAYDQPFVEWLSPNDGDTVLFPYNFTDDLARWVWFNFEYNYMELTDIILEIEGVSFGSVWNKTYIRLFPYIDGPVAATLYGYNGTDLMDTDTINLNFVRIIHEVLERVDFGTEILGKQLYLILHDPHGDNSFSSYTESTTLSIGVGCEITNELSTSIEIGGEFELFGIGSGASTALTMSSTTEMGLDFRFEVTDITQLTSNKESNNPDYIGPGLGDMYWGESWIYKWELNATRRVYSNNTNLAIYQAPHMYYGILRDVETIANDYMAPENWTQLNPFHNNYTDVSWIAPFACPGGEEFTRTHIITSTVARSVSFGIEFSTEAKFKMAILEVGMQTSLSLRNFAEQSLGHSIETSYTVYDDEPTDHIVQGVGIDNRFGTYIFNSSSYFCETSLPLEHNTYDYVPPIIEFPDIDLDTDDDGFSPTTADSPYVTVEIFEEGEIQDAIINYTIDDGLHWDIIHLHEQVANPGTWAANIPAQPFNTTVRWYIMAWDEKGGKAIKLNETGYPYSYTVIRKRSEPSEAIPSFPLMTIIPIMLVAVVAIITVYHRKHIKLKK